MIYFTTNYKTKYGAKKCTWNCNNDYILLSVIIFSIVETLEVSTCLSNGDLKGFPKAQIMTGLGIDYRAAILLSCNNNFDLGNIFACKNFEKI